jgi:hypothetical protein
MSGESLDIDMSVTLEKFANQDPLMTPLMIAASLDSTIILKILLKAGLC